MTHGFHFLCGLRILPFMEQGKHNTKNTYSGHIFLQCALLLELYMRLQLHVCTCISHYVDGFCQQFLY